MTSVETPLVATFYTRTRLTGFELDMPADSPLTFNQAVRGIAEFIEVAIHTILYIRQIYPAELFVRRKKYNTPVFQSRHPALNEYISGAIKAITEELVLGHVNKVVVVIKDKEEVPLERFIFALQCMIELESYNKDTSVQEAMTSTALGQYFRSFMVKLNMAEAQLGQLEMCGTAPFAKIAKHVCYNNIVNIIDDLSFAIVLELQDDKAPAASHGQDPPSWIPATTPHTTAGTHENAELHMIRAVDTGIINATVQESEAKLKRGQEDLKGKGRAS
ncbi:uncharacterized protein FIBRA_06625 [Fibroporia radiculosa]|uniref:HORMA domain-containing protein n=1 Tax=Fibroporia radiculosa TaxID=599839 RepID=J4GT35_9APHY|nr:uncharacterized protein FIBRA_06625 [Fibroporia radiculosa]CCM04445.1 predicted protein [Fibroporia radiculosa]